MADTNTRRSRPAWGYVLVIIAAAAAALAVGALLVNIATRRQEERAPYARLVEVTEVTSAPQPWGVNWPREYDGYGRTVDVTETRFGGSSAIPEQKLDAEPWLRRMYSGYAFSLDYRRRRGHAYMLYDQEVTERVTKKPQPGACLHCHASVTPTWRRLGLQAAGKPTDAQALGGAFDWPMVMRGFELMNKMTYAQARGELAATPDGTPSSPLPAGGGTTGTPSQAPATGPGPGGAPGSGNTPGTGGAPAGGAGPSPATPPGTAGQVAGGAPGGVHPVSCLDCHDPRTMAIRVTRPGFVLGIRALAASDAPVPLPSITRWREGRRAEPYDPNVDASRQELRTFVCAQCHVEYYCGPKMLLTFPWGRGLRVDDIEAYWNATRFPEGEPFYDWKHGETGAEVYKAQHPEFELWSQGPHAKAGVGCPDCHMPYLREGASKVSDHWVRSPLLMVNRACQVCHSVPEQELRARVDDIQRSTRELLDRSAVALTDMLDALAAAKAAGATPAQLRGLHELQRAAQWRIDFISSENSTGFHAAQEAARALGEAIDFARQAQAGAVALRAPPAPKVKGAGEPVYGVTPAAQAPPAADTKAKH